MRAKLGSQRDPNDARAAAGKAIGWPAIQTAAVIDDRQLPDRAFGEFASLADLVFLWIKEFEDNGYETLEEAPISP